MRFGVCYYPEQWPASRWAIDAEMMADLGLAIVRIGEFAWARYEPARGQWDWGWLDEAIDSLAGAGLDVMLGTPTAAPPIWLATERPEIMAVGPDGRIRAYGSRRHTCPTSAAYREESLRVTTALAERYGDHPAVTAWQVDNEPGNHDSARCWCGECGQAFQGWLRDRYGAVEKMNEAWGTVFWSQTYPSFERVRLPAPTTAAHNPALLLAHRRFASAQAVAGLAEQFALLAAEAPQRPITSNVFPADLHVNSHRVAELGGVSSWDSYPHGWQDPGETALFLDIGVCAAGPDGDAWITEQQAGRVNWTSHNPMVREGQVRMWAWQAALHGVGTLLFFRWRAARHGQEQYHSGLLLQDGSPSQALAEVREVIGELSETDVGGRRGNAALLHSFDDAWSIDIDPHLEGVTHRGLLLTAHRSARRLGFEVDVVEPTADLTGYLLVLAPGLNTWTEQRVASIEAALEAGAIVVLGPRSLVKDEEGGWVDQAVPAGLAGRLGAKVVDFGSPGDAVSVAPHGTAAGEWVEILDVGEAETIATFSGSHLRMKPAAVRSGNLAYFAFSDEASWTAVLGTLTNRYPGPAHEERFVRSGHAVIIDHQDLVVQRLT